MVDFNIQVKLDPEEAQAGTDQIGDALKGVEAAATKTGTTISTKIGQGTKTGADEAEKNLARIQTSLNTIQSTVNSAFAFAGIGLGLHALVDLDDEFTSIQNKLLLISSGTADVNDKFNTLLKLSSDTRTGLGTTVDLFERLSGRTTAYNLTQRDLIDITKNVNEAIAFTGTSAGQAAEGLRALNSIITTGVVNIRNFREIMLSVPGVIEVLGNRLGKTSDQLLAMATDGQLSAQQILDAFRGTDDFLDNKFNSTVITLSQSLQVFKDRFGAAAYGAGAGSGLFNSLGSAVLFLSNHMDGLILVIGGLVTAFTALKIVSLATELFGALSAAVIFLAETPIIAVIAGLTGLTTWFINSTQAGQQLWQTFKDGLVVLGLMKEATDQAAQSNLSYNDTAHEIRSVVGDTTVVVNKLTGETKTLGADGKVIYDDLFAGARAYGDALRATQKDTETATNDLLHMKDAADQAAAALRNLQEVAGRTGGGPVTGTNTGDVGIVARAAGGPVLGGQMALVGERGPELIIPSVNSTVLPVDRTRDLLHRASGGPIPAGTASIVGEGGPELVISGDNPYAAFQDVFSSQASRVSFAYAAAAASVPGADQPIGSEYLPSPDSKIVISPDVLSIHSYADDFAKVLNVALNAGQINSGQNQVITQVLNDVASDWDTFRTKGAIKGIGLAANNNGMFPYFSDARDLISQYNYLSNFVGAVYGSGLLSDITNARSNSIAGGGAGGIGSPANSNTSASADAKTWQEILAVQDYHNSGDALLAAWKALISDPNITTDIVQIGNDYEKGAFWHSAVAPGRHSGPSTPYELLSEAGARRKNGLDYKEIGVIPPSIADALGVGLGFQFGTGGDFTVPGSGSVDSQLVQFFASPGERVKVSTPNSPSGGGSPINLSMTIVTKDADSFRANQDQILTNIEGKLHRIRKKLGER